MPGMCPLKVFPCFLRFFVIVLIFHLLQTSYGGNLDPPAAKAGYLATLAARLKACPFKTEKLRERFTRETRRTQSKDKELIWSLKGHSFSRAVKLEKQPGFSP